MNNGPFIPDIEPLPDTTWKSIERKIFAELDRDGDEPSSFMSDHGRDHASPGSRHFSRRVLVGVAGCAAAAAALLVLFLNRGDSDPGAHAVAKSPTSPEGTYLETSQSSSRLLIDGSSITVTPRSRLWYTDSRSGVTVQLERGRVECSVRPQPAGSTFKIRAADVEVEVVGTRFSVDRTGDVVEVEVTEGEIEILHDGIALPVTSGQRWSSEHGLLPFPDTAVTRHDNRANAEDKPASSSTRRHPIDTRKDMFFRAAEFEERDHEKAMERYTELARGQDIWAANALYAHALLCAHYQRRDEARRLANEYLTRFPRGANRADARTLLDELDNAATRDD